MKTHPFHKVGGSYIYWVATGLAELVDTITAVDEFSLSKSGLKRLCPVYLYDCHNTVLYCQSNSRSKMG